MSGQMTGKSHESRLRFASFVLIAITIPLGFGLKYYPGPGHDAAGSVLGWALLNVLANRIGRHARGSTPR
jgi:hypothetical protein